MGSGAVYDPPTVTQSTIVRVETLVYDLAKNELVGASESDATDPTNLPSMLQNVAHAVGSATRTVWPAACVHGVGTLELSTVLAARYPARTFPCQRFAPGLAADGA